MSLAFCKIALCIPAALIAIGAYAQEVPLSAEIHQRTDVIVDGKVVKTQARDMNFYRLTDGSTLTVPVGEGDNNGTLWDNKTGTAYRIDLKGRIAYEDPHSPHVPNRSAHNEPNASFPDDAVEGIPCKVVPVYVRSKPGTPLLKSATPGRACVSGALNLELKSDVVVQTGAGATEHLVKELRNIKVNAELDQQLFDPGRYTIYGPKN